MNNSAPQALKEHVSTCEFCKGIKDIELQDIHRIKQELVAKCNIDTSKALPKLDLTFTIGQYIVAQMTFDNSKNADKYLLKQPKEAVMLSSVHALLEEIEKRMIQMKNEIKEGVYPFELDETIKQIQEARK